MLKTEMKYQFIYKVINIKITAIKNSFYGIHISMAHSSDWSICCYLQTAAESSLYVFLFYICNHDHNVDKSKLQNQYFP